MTLFGLLWILVLVACFRNIKTLAFATIVSSTIQCSNVIEIGGVGIGPQIITSLVFIIRASIMMSGKIKIFKKYLRYILIIMLLIISFLYMSSLYNNVITDCLIKIMQFAIYIICFYCMACMGKYFKDEEIYIFIRRLSIAILAIGFVQFAITAGIIPRISIIKVLLYNDPNTDVVYFNTDNWLRFTSTYMEPSYYAGFLVGSFYYFLSRKEFRKNNLFLMGIIFLQLILTFSSTAYGAFAIIGIIYFINSKEIRFKFKLALLACLGFAVMYFLFRDILDSVIFYKFEGDSFAGRAPGIEYALKLFKISPIIGNGYKVARASSIIETMLAETGVIGFSLYILWILPFVFMLRKLKGQNAKFGITLAVLSTFVAQMIAVPDLDLCTHWMWLNLFALQYTSLERMENAQKNDSYLNTGRQEIDRKLVRGIL